MPEIVFRFELFKGSSAHNLLSSMPVNPLANIEGWADQLELVKIVWHRALQLTIKLAILTFFQKGDPLPPTRIYRK